MPKGIDDVDAVDVDDDNLQNLENVPDPTPVAVNAPPVLNWKTYCIFCPKIVANLQNLFASFCHYSKANFMKISGLDMFLIMMPMNSIEDTVIKKTN